MKLTIFGASGATGGHVVEQALAAGHHVTAVARETSPWQPPEHDGLSVVRADVMDSYAIAPSIAGRDAVVTTIGTREGRAPTTVCEQSVVSILDAMRACGVGRLIMVSAAGTTTDGDGPIMRVLAKPLLQKLLAAGFADMRRAERVLFASDTAWTVLRPPMLTNGAHTGDYRVQRGGNVRRGIRISRADLATAILRSIEDPSQQRAAVGVAH